MKIQYGYCHCGCGGKTQLSKNNHKKRGYEAGKPFKYISQHHTYKSLAEYRIDENGCWRWLRGMAGKYGVKMVDGKNRYAHRVYYENEHGPISPGLHIDHLCRVTDCVNPEHLEAVTPKENVIRGSNTKIKSGMSLGIVRMRSGGMLLREIAKEFGVSISTIRYTLKKEAA